MPNASVVKLANTSGRRLSAWTVDPTDKAAGPLRGHQHVVVPAFAGAGKSYQVTRACARGVRAGARVLVTAGTNEQVRDLAVRLHRLGLAVTHYPAHGEEIIAPPARLNSSRDLTLLHQAQLVVATVYQAGKLAKDHPSDIGTFDVGFLDEAYQVATSSAALHALTLAARWAFVGDPGQIATFTRLGVSPFQGADDPVANVVASARAQGCTFGELALDWTWRLPHHGAPVLAPFYGRTVVSAATASDRTLTLGPRRLRRGVARSAATAVDRAAALGWGYLELPGDPLEAADPETATALAHVVDAVLTRGTTASCERDGTRPLGPADVGVMVATDAQRSLTEQALTSAGHRHVAVRTYNKAQGLEFAVSVLWHPLSGVEEINEFTVDLGRLCVGVSRHRQAAVIVGQGGLRRHLDDPPMSPEAPWPGERDRFLAGWLAHTRLVEMLDTLGATVPA